MLNPLARTNLPISMMDMLELECCRASSSQLPPVEGLGFRVTGFPKVLPGILEPTVARTRRISASASASQPPKIYHGASRWVILGPWPRG